MCVCLCVCTLVNDPPCRALNPCRGTLVEPVTNWRRRPLLSSLKASTACQNHRTTLLSLVQCFRRVFVFQSARSIFPKPPMMSYGRERERVTKGKSRINADCEKRSACYLQFFMVKRFEEVLRDELTEAFLQSQKLSFDSTHEPPVHIKPDGQTQMLLVRIVKGNKQSPQRECWPYLTYSFLLSSVTGMLRPFGLSSCCKNFPKALCSTQKVWSRTEVMSFSLHTKNEFTCQLRVQINLDII